MKRGGWLCESCGRVGYLGNMQHCFDVHIERPGHKEYIILLKYHVIKSTRCISSFSSTLLPWFNIAGLFFHYVPKQTCDLHIITLPSIYLCSFDNSSIIHSMFMNQWECVYDKRMAHLLMTIHSVNRVFWASYISTQIEK